MRWQRGQDKMLHEDNTGAMILAKLEPGRMPQAALEAVWSQISLVQIETETKQNRDGYK
jgi:hypothetical protein